MDCSTLLMAQVSFFSDDRHIDGSTGSRVLAELVIHLLEQTMADVKALPVSEAEKRAAEAALPGPMTPYNYEGGSSRCFLNEQLIQTVAASQGYEW